MMNVYMETMKGSLPCPERNESDYQLTQQIYWSNVSSKSEKIVSTGLLVMLFMARKDIDGRTIKFQQGFPPLKIL